MEDRKISDSWRLCEDLTVREAALLFAGCDPVSSDGSLCEQRELHERPAGYEGAKRSISSALRKGQITGRHTPESIKDRNGDTVGFVSNSTDIYESEVDLDSLVQWLCSKGITTGFFFPAAAETPDYLDPGHPRYRKELAAAVSAWLALEDENLLKGKTPKQALISWVESRYKELGLFHEKDDPKNSIKKGDVNKSAIERVVAFSNWKEGGPPKTPGG